MYDGKENERTEPDLSSLPIGHLEFLIYELSDKRDADRMALAKLELKLAAIKAEIGKRQ